MAEFLISNARQGMEKHFSDNGMLKLLDNVATTVTSGLEVPTTTTTSSGLQGHNEDITINIERTVFEPTEVPTGEPGDVPNMSPVQLIQALITVSMLTLIFVISTALYKPARGVVFASHRLAYYLTLTAIFVSGLAEAFTAFWMSRYRDTDQRCFSWGRLILCVSLGPFVAILAIGGFAFIGN